MQQHASHVLPPGYGSVAISSDNDALIYRNFHLTARDILQLAKEGSRPPTPGVCRGQPGRPRRYIELTNLPSDAARIGCRQAGMQVRVRFVLRFREALHPLRQRMYGHGSYVIYALSYHSLLVCSCCLAKWYSQFPSTNHCFAAVCCG